jgi:hypothetical protein
LRDAAAITRGVRVGEKIVAFCVRDARVQVTGARALGKRLRQKDATRPRRAAVPRTTRWNRIALSTARSASARCSSVISN